MGHTNSTANYNLPQFVGTDKPSWLGDINNAFSAIDTAIANAASTATTADGKADALGTTVSGHTTQIGTLSNTVTAQGNTLNTVTALIGNGTPTTTDQTIIGAINEINAEVNPGYVEVTADGVKTISQLMDNLHALIDLSKVNKDTKFEYITGTSINYMSIVSISSGNLSFTNVSYIVGSSAAMTSYLVKSSGSTKFDVSLAGTPTITLTENSNQVPTSGHIYRIEY